jgi:glycosyltransferase involved in cell wall biosynthesis
MRVLMFADYRHPAQHRKVELLADAEDVDLVQIVGPLSGRSAGRHPSANSRRAYAIRLAPETRSLGRPDDPHRIFGWPPRYGLRSFKPDLIHYEGEVESIGAAEIVLLKKLLAPRAALILTSWQNILRPRSPAVRLINDFNLQAAQHVLCAGHEAVTVLRQQGYAGGASVCPIVGLDTRYFYPRPVPGLRERLGLHGLVVGYIGRIVADKGIDTLLLAAAKLSAPVQVLIVGDGPDRERLQALARASGLADRCQFVSAVPYDAVPDYMNLLDVLALPSRTTLHWKEQFGRVLIEAMACQVVVVGSDSGEIPAVIDDPDRVFPEGEAAALARIIERLAADADWRRQSGERDRLRAIERYSVEQLARHTLTVWHDLYDHQLRSKN